jgi:thioredoxin-dependent peroxiredoxin
VRGSLGRMADRSIGVGDSAPDFTLDSGSGPVTLSAYQGHKVVVLYFYPKDDSFGCTREACAFRDAFEDFVEAGAEVIGVSSDSVASHESFAGRHRLPFTLVADPGGVIRRQYGVPSTLGVLPGRVTYVIDRDGVVRHVFNSQLRFGDHVEQALTVVRRLTADSNRD